MDEKSKRFLSHFEESTREGWVENAEYKAVIKEIETLGLSPKGIDRLRHQIMQVLLRQAPDERNKRLVTWADKAMAFLKIAPGAIPSTRVFFTPGDACHQAVLSCLESACSSLDVCVFTITDDRITDGIRKAAKRGVRIRIITDDKKTKALGSDIFLLAASGLQVRQDYSENHMHHKFAIVDENEVITGSFNWTEGASDNHENILICVDSQVARAYRQEFDRLWKTMDPVRTS